MNRKEVKTKARVSSKAKFAKKIQRKDNKANSKQPKNSKKRRVDAKFRPRWSVGGDIDNQNDDNNIDVDDIKDMVDRDGESGDLISGYLNSIESQYENRTNFTNVVQPVEKMNVSEEKSDSEEEEDEEDDQMIDEANMLEQQENADNELAKHSYMENLVIIRKKKAALQEEVALTCDAIMSHPEANISRMKRLFALLDTSVSDPEYGIIFFNVQQTVTESLCIIFNDIIPNYRLAERFNFQDAEVSGGKKHQLKQNTMKTYIYEKNVMQYYKLYLQRLERIINAELDTSSKSNFYKVMLTTGKARRKLAYVACFCLSDLLLHHYNFNYRLEVITNLTKVLCNTSRVDEFMRDICAKAIHRLFKSDTLGEASLEAINMISEFVVKKNYRVSPLVFKTFLALNLRELASDNTDNNNNQAKLVKGKGAPKKDRKLMSRKERKRAKHFGKLEKEMLEADAVESNEKRHSHKVEIHKKIFALYFRFVKRCLDVNSLSSEQEIRDFDRWYRPLFPALFQGMAQYSVFLNDVFIYELIEALLKLIQGDKLKGEQQISQCRLSSTERLCCLKTISQILTLSGNLLTIDFQVPYIILYELCTDPIVIYESMSMLLQCIDEMILKRFKQLSLKRVISLVQRLILLSLYLSGPEAAAFLTVIKLLFQQHQGAAESLFENEDGEQWLGIDRLPEFCHNPELVSTREANSMLNFHVLLHQHCDPYVRYQAYAILNHFSDSQGRTTNIVENRAIGKKGKELNLEPELCSELVRAYNPVHVYNLLNLASVNLGHVFHKLPTITLKKLAKEKLAKLK